MHQGHIFLSKLKEISQCMKVKLKVKIKLNTIAYRLVHRTKNSEKFLNLTRSIIKLANIYSGKIRNKVNENTE